MSPADRPMTFGRLQAAAETNPSVLNGRLKELRSAGIVDHGAEGYRLSPDGAALPAVVLPLSRWADAWAMRREFSSNAAERG